MSPITLTNCIVLTVDSDDKIIQNGRVVIDRGVIQAVGASEAIEAHGEAVDLRGRLLMPGLLNAHTHSPAAVLRGYADDYYLRDWLENYIWPAEKHLTAEYAYWGARLSYLEFLYNGMTTNVDMWYFADSLAKAAMDTGLRAVVAAGVFGFPSPESASPIRDAFSFVEHFWGREGDTLVYPALGPHDASTCPPGLLRELSEFAVQKDIVIHAHLSEAAEDNQEIQKKYGISPTQYFGRYRNHARAYTVRAQHPYERRRHFHIKEANSAGCYNPVSNMKLCDGVMPLKRLKAAGVPVAVGVDGAQATTAWILLPMQKRVRCYKSYAMTIRHSCPPGIPYAC
jgi:5-methylthioadenosine/S-adenosylhomocysteine deaminase